MPCRALGAFGPTQMGRWVEKVLARLNALSGIGCVRTKMIVDSVIRLNESLNALSGIGCVRTKKDQAYEKALNLAS